MRTPRQPMIYTANRRTLFGILNFETKTKDGIFVPKRPSRVNFLPWKFRWRVAWGVLTGKYDALEWEDGQ